MGFLNQPILSLLGNHKLMVSLFLSSIEGPIKEGEFHSCMNKGSEFCVGQVEQAVMGVEKSQIWSIQESLYRALVEQGSSRSPLGVSDVVESMMDLGIQ